MRARHGKQTCYFFWPNTGNTGVQLCLYNAANNTAGKHMVSEKSIPFPFAWYSDSYGAPNK